MRIGLNAYLCAPEANYRRTGIHRYIHELAVHLARLQDGPDLLAYVAGEIREFGDCGIDQRVAPIPVRNPAARIGFELTGLPVLTARDRLDLFHGPVNTIPFGLRMPALVTVHDLAFLYYPEHITRGRYRYLRTMIGSSVRRARMILTPSEATRQDVVERFRIDPDKVRVTPLGVDGRFRQAAGEPELARFGLERPFVLFVGTVEPRKNLARLIAASDRLQEVIEHDLVLAGPDGWLMVEIRAALEGYRHGDRLRRLGFVDDRDLADLYAGAAVVAIPSLYEGFGLPVLEAMSAGAAVLTANVSSLPEVAGEAAELVDPVSVDSIAAGLERVLTDTGRRDELRRLGPIRASTFTWERTASATLDAYLEAAK
ncbi:MAG: glycosyltransferase family 4 protein [Chloroflexota bacterium]|nr:glycosyltransferase family 4 protein [Chloroflexota bacterium]